MEAHIWAEIRRLREVDRLSKSEISRRMKLDRKTVRLALERHSAPERKTASEKVSKLDAYKDYIRERLTDYPHIPATTIYEEIRRRGYPGKMRILWEYVAGQRKRKSETFLRIETLPGEFAQVDWADCGKVVIGNATRRLSCFLMVLSYSRMMYLEFRLSQRLEDFMQCHVNAFRFFGGVTQKILYDNLKSVVFSRFGGQSQMNPRFMEMAGVFLFEPILCNPGRGNEKGKVESGVKYIRSGFLSGRVPAWPEIQAEAAFWRDETANIRIHATTRERPLDRFEKEKPHLLSLPEKEYDASLPWPTTANSQALVHFDGNIYSVPYALAYQPLIVRADLNEVRVLDGLKLIARHKRSFERGVVVEDPKHYEGLLAEKKKAMVGKIQAQFLALGEPAKAYLQGLAASELHLSHHVQAILECVRLYGKTEVLQAIDHSLRHQAYGSHYLKNIILQQRAARGMKENMPIVIPAKPAWTQLCVEEQDLSLYDDLFEGGENNVTK